MKFKKGLFSVLSVGILTIGAGAAVSAATYGSYAGNVPVINDLETAPIKKETTGSAYNKVSSIASGTLVSWVENSTGTNVTNKVSYSTTGTKTMDYTSASTQKGKSLKLNISTSKGTWYSVYTKGTWTPN